MLGTESMILYKPGKHILSPRCNPRLSCKTLTVLYLFGVRRVI